MRIFFRPICKENRNIYFTFNNFFFLNRAVYEIMCKNIVESGRSHMTIWRMGTARWIPNVTDTRLEYVIRIGFPLQQW